MPEPARIRRFGRTERLLHWTHATAFLLLAATGLALSVPALAELVGRRHLVRGVHLWLAAAWVLALAAIVLLGDRRRLREDWRELETIDADDRRFLAGRRAPQGRFNAGQKVNALLTAAFALLLLVSGLFLWLGERNHALILPGAVAVHDTLTYLSLFLLVGHLYLAVIHPGTRHALRGMTRGDVEESWAARHHPKWVAAERRGRRTGDEPVAARRLT